MRRLLVLVVLALLLCGGTSSGLAAPAEDRRAVTQASSWLLGQPLAIPAGQQADTIVALRKAGIPRSRLRARVRRLAKDGPRYASGPGQAAKVARAARAVGANPRRFGKVNYIARITAGYRRGQYGRDAFSHSLSMMALARSGRRVPPRAIRELMLARGTGGWGFELRRGGVDQVDTTALAIQALRAAGVPRRDGRLRAATAWMIRQRNARGGFDSRGGRRPTEANSTAAVILALRTMGASTGRERRELRTLQRRNGYFLWRQRVAGSTLLATLDAVLALS